MLGPLSWGVSVYTSLLICKCCLGSYTPSFHLGLHRLRARLDPLRLNRDGNLFRTLCSFWRKSTDVHRSLPPHLIRAFTSNWVGIRIWIQD
uniref:Putative secreted protein n=1 Tax=Ixodes ricinus TaxID=34613 RepID=A0A6B0U3U2_IXORI